MIPPRNAKVHLGDTIDQDLSPGKKGTVTEVSTEPLTEAKVLSDAGIDLSEWEVGRAEPGQWQGYAKLSDDTIVITTLYRMKLTLRPRPDRWAIEATDLFTKAMKDHRPDYSGWKPPRKTQGEWLAIVGLYDVHFGKLCWAPETGTHYDLKIVRRLYRDAIERTMAACCPYKIDRWYLPIGQDMLQCDGIASTTTAGTPQDVDGRYPKIVAACEETLIEAIDKLVKVAPVECSYHASNHDRHAAFHIARTLAAHYRTVKSVTVDADWRARKYMQYGKTLLGFSHGDKIKPAKLATLMPHEAPEAWSKTTCREFLTGHIHHERVMTTAADQMGSVTVRSLRSMSGHDAWHYESGWVSDRATEAHLYHKLGKDQLHFTFGVKEESSA